MTKSRAARTPPPKRSRAVSRPHDPAEVQADKAADVVARGGSVTGWSFGSVPVDAGVHREEKGKPSDEDKLKEAAKKTGEAALETEAGKKLQEKVKETPLVKQATKFLDTTPGKIVAGGAIAAGVGGLAAGKQPLPFQAPDIPLDKVTPGLSAKVTVEGPVNAPTFVGLSLTYKEQGPKKPQGKDSSTIAERAAAIRAQGAAQAEMFKPQAQKDQEKADEQAFIAKYVASQQKLFGSSTLLPLNPADKPKSIDVPKVEPSEPKKEKDEAPVQREPATAATEHAPALDSSGLDGAVRGGGRALDPATRRSMEARFGYDFSSVRLHDDGAASSAAARVEASAFTVGEDIVFGHAGYDPSTPQGRHLLAHELAHVVQQRGQGGSGGEHVHRRSIFESIGILLGLEEGNWTDQELRAYLDTLTSSGRIDGSYDADNKARAIVRKWKQGSPGWDLLGPQKALLIDEMIDGPTLGDDEACILDLLELSDAGDLRVIFKDSQTRTLSLEDNIQGDNRVRLNAFEASRFSGGRTELLAGRVTVLGDPIPAGAPSYGFSAATFDARLEDRSAEEMIALFDRFSPADKVSATNHLMREFWPKAEAAESQADAEVDDAEAAGATTTIEKAKGRSKSAEARRQKGERVLAHYFGGRLPESIASLEATTKAVDRKRSAELSTALVRPPDKPGAGFRDADAAAYRAAITAAVPIDVEDYYKITVLERGARVPTAEVDPIAKLAKDEVDAVFGRYYDLGAHPQLVFDKPAVPAAKGRPGALAKRGTLHSWFETAEKDRGTFGDLAIAKGWLRYYITAHRTFRRINAKYAAAPEYERDGAGPNKEAKIILDVIEVATRDKETVRKLVEALSNWGAMSRAGEVFVDLFHRKDPTKDRLDRWDMLQALIHEYVHTLRHKEYDTFADSLGETSPANNTLIEGMDDVLDTLVWDRLVPRLTDPAVRKVVEPTYANLPHVEVPPPGHYPSFAEALRLVDLVGIDNVCAAYFRGLVDRISGTAKAGELTKAAQTANARADAKKKGSKP